VPAFQIFSGALSTAFQDSKGLIIELERIVLNFELIVAVPATLEWYLSFLDGDLTPTPKWFREASNEAGTNGAVKNSEILRTLTPVGGGPFAAGSHLLSVEVPRRQQMTKASFRAPVGSASLVVRSVTGIGPIVV
jgi:hypothetical protein